MHCIRLLYICRFQYFMKNETNKCSARLLVNGTTAVSGEQTLPLRGSLPRHANLHLGGIPLVFSHYFAHVSMGFTGCMNSLKVRLSYICICIFESIRKIKKHVLLI